MKERTENALRLGNDRSAPINRTVPAFRTDPKDPHASVRHSEPTLSLALSLSKEPKPS